MNSLLNHLAKVIEEVGWCIESWVLLHYYKPLQSGPLSLLCTRLIKMPCIRTNYFQKVFISTDITHFFLMSYRSSHSVIFARLYLFEKCSSICQKDPRNTNKEMITLHAYLWVNKCFHSWRLHCVNPLSRGIFIPRFLIKLIFISGLIFGCRIIIRQ